MPMGEKTGNERQATPAAVIGPFEPDPVIEAYKRDLDLALLEENLRRTVDERVLNLMALQRLAEEARRAGRKASQSRAPRPDRA